MYVKSPFYGHPELLPGSVFLQYSGNRFYFLFLDYYSYLLSVFYKYYWIGRKKNPRGLPAAGRDSIMNRSEAELTEGNSPVQALTIQSGRSAGYLR